MALTQSQLLELLDTAITEILTKGQTFALGGRANSRADLGELRKWRKEVADQVELQAGGRIRNLVRFDKTI
jgi:hypothetical protein